jgi:hypothetical protein
LGDDPQCNSRSTPRNHFPVRAPAHGEPRTVQAPAHEEKRTRESASVAGKRILLWRRESIAPAPVGLFSAGVSAFFSSAATSAHRFAHAARSSREVGQRLLVAEAGQVGVFLTVAQRLVHGRSISGLAALQLPGSAVTPTHGGPTSS